MSSRARCREAAGFQKQIRDLGGVFMRQATHGDLYRMPNGKIIMCSTKFTRARDILNMRADIRRLTAKA